MVRRCPLRFAEFILRPRFARTGGLSTSPVRGGGGTCSNLYRPPPLAGEVANRVSGSSEGAR
jgi:hypothetical protein